MKRISRGFTLIEMLVTLLIFSILALASYRGLSAVLDAREHIRSETDKWRGIESFVRRFGRDLMLAAPVGGRSGRGTTPAWSASACRSQAPCLEFLRFSEDPGTGGLQRIAYRLNDKKEIELWLWPGPDGGNDASALRYPVLLNVERFELRFLDTRLAWKESWPGPGIAAVAPRAVEMRIYLATGEEILRVFAL